MTDPDLLPLQIPVRLNRNRPDLLPPTSTILLTPPTYDHSKPKPPPRRTPATKANVHFNPNYSPTVHPPGLLHHRTSTILYCIRGHTYSNPDLNHTMRKPTRTPQCRHLPTILHISKLAAPFNHDYTPVRKNRYPTPTDPRTNPSNPIHFVDKHSIRASTAYSVYSKSPPIRLTPLTTKGPRRGSHRRLNTPRRSSIKTRRLRDHTSHPAYRATIQPPPLPFPYLSPMRCPNNQLNLPPTDRPKITNRLLIRQPHGISHRRRNNPNPLIILGSNNPNDLPRTNLFYTILPG